MPEISVEELINYMLGYDWIASEEKLEDREPEEPETQKPYCPICGAEMEFDDTVCWNCNS